MAIDQSLADILDETVEALSNLDSAKLHALTQRIAVLAEANMNHERDDIGLVLLKKRQLEIMLQNCQTNLDALTRLHARNMRNRWVQ
jgi:primosomal protein N''